MNGNLIYTAPSEDSANKITTILNFMYDENFKKSNNLDSVMVESYVLDEVLEHISAIIKPFGWVVSEIGSNEKSNYAIFRKLGKLSLLPPVVFIGSNIYLDETRTIVNRPSKYADNRPTGKGETPESPTNKQVGGSHHQLPIQPIEYILANGLGYCEANVVKYVSRWRNKGGIQDIKKAIHYLEMLIEQEEKDESKKS